MARLHAGPGVSYGIVLQESDRSPHSRNNLDSPCQVEPGQGSPGLHLDQDCLIRYVFTLFFGKGAREMVQQLRALSDLVEASSAPSTHMGEGDKRFTTAYNSRGSEPLYWPL